MYQTHWGLQRAPFRGTRDLPFFYSSPTHEEALARLQFLVDQQRRVGLLLGPRGSGKSLLLRVFAQQLARQGTQALVIPLAGLTPRRWLWTLAAQLGACPSSHASRFELWRQVCDKLVEARYQQQATVLLLDDADEADPRTLAALVPLLHADPEPHGQPTAVLVAPPQRLAPLGERLLELAELRIELEPWEESDTAGFLKAGLEWAGGRTEVFEPQAAARLHELAHGIPRQVNQLAELSLLAGAGQNLNLVDCNTVNSVFGELSVHTSGVESS